MRVKLEPGAIAPTRAHTTDAGIDLYAFEDRTIKKKSKGYVRTGVHIELPHGTAGLIITKSGLAKWKGIFTTGLIDEGYSGEICVLVQNFGFEDFTFKKGDKVSQLVVIPVLYENIDVVDEINQGERGDNGFGSTGYKWYIL